MGKTRTNAENNGKVEKVGTLPTLPDPVRIGDVLHVPVYVPVADVEAIPQGYMREGRVHLDAQLSGDLGLTFNRIRQAVLSEVAPTHPHLVRHQISMTMRAVLERVHASVATE